MRDDKQRAADVADGCAARARVLAELFPSLSTEEAIATLLKFRVAFSVDVDGTMRLDVHARRVTELDAKRVLFAVFGLKWKGG